MKKFLFVGLGNIGDEYQHSRHNIGFDCLDFFVTQNNAVWSISRLAILCSFTIKGKKIICIKPTTYMNLSGKAVKYYLDKENIDLQNLVIIVDDLNLPLGKVNLRIAGSSGGHNGLKHIEECLLTNQYPRLRCGIGNNYIKGKQADFVLSKWNNDEKEAVKKITIQVCDALQNIALIGIDKAMNWVNAPVKNKI